MHKLTQQEIAELEEDIREGAGGGNLEVTLTPNASGTYDLHCNRATIEQAERLTEVSISVMRTTRKPQ